MTVLLSKIKEMREAAGLSQKRFAQKVGVSEMTVRRWEAGQRSPSAEALLQISSVLKTNVAYLMGQSDDSSIPSIMPIHVHLVDSDEEVDDFLQSGIPSLPENKERETDEPQLRIPIQPLDRIPGADYNLVKLPVLSMASVVCAGNGFSLEFVDEEIESYDFVRRADLGPIDENNKPFVVPIEGDSMEDAGIPDGSRVAINPAAQVYDGNAALVCYGLNRERAVKWVYWQTDNSVKIRSANPRYEPRVFTKEDIELGFFFVVGKVMQVITRPLNG